MAKKLARNRQYWEEQPIEDFTLDLDSPLYQFLNAVLVPIGGKYTDVKAQTTISYSTPFSPSSVKDGSAVNNNGGNAQVLGFSQGQTFSRIAVIKPSIATGERTISVGGANNLAGGSQFRQNGTELGLLRAQQASVGTSSGAQLQIGKTSIVGVTYDNSTVRFYCDGRAIGSNAGVHTFAQNGSGRVGANVNTGEAFQGALGLMLDFNQALSQSEMLALTINPWQIFKPKRRIYFIGAGGTPVIFDLNAASFNLDSLSNQNKQTAITNTPPTLKWSAKAVQNRATVSLATPPTLQWSAKAIQNRLTTTHNSAVFSWSAKAITFALGIPLVVMDLVNATFRWSAKTVQNSLTATHNSAIFSWSAKAIQNLRTIALSAPSLTWSAKALQNRLTATQTAAQIRLTALANSARLSLSLVNATMASWSAKAIQMKQTVTLNNAVFNWSSKVVEIITDAVVDLARRGRSRYSHYRQLLKQRRY